MKRIISIFILLLFTLFSYSQLTKIQLEKLLTNGNSRSWKFREYKKSLGSECIGNGQLYIFSKNGKVQRKGCVNGKRVYKELKWEISSQGTGANTEWQLKLSEPIEVEDGKYLQEMRIDLPLGEIDKQGKQMIWRVVPDSKLNSAQIVTLISMN